MPPRPQEVETWIFDLDNTLYPASSNLFALISHKMTGYIMELLGLDETAARIEQKRLFRAHGTTLRGLMMEYHIDPHGFLDHVHDVDLETLAAAPALGRALAALPGRKLIHTNGSVRHAERILGRLGLQEHFSEIWDIVASEFVPKPDGQGYRGLLARHSIEPGRAAMVEDMACNLKPAAELGMFTLWIRTGEATAIADAGEFAPYIHDSTDDLAGWLVAHTSANLPADPAGKAG